MYVIQTKKMNYLEELRKARKQFGKDFVFSCGHCGKSHPENLNYHGLNCCNTCMPNVKYIVIYETEETLYKITKLLTLKECQNFIERKKNYQNIENYRIILNDCWSKIHNEYLLRINKKRLQKLYLEVEQLEKKLLIS